jgi:hypothetical protein
MLSSLQMGLRLFWRTRLLLVWLLTMVVMASLRRDDGGLSPGTRDATWILWLAVVPGFFTTVFAREFLAQPLSFFMPGIRRRVFRLQLGLCLLAGLLAMLGMRAVASLAWSDAGAYGAFGLAYAASICILTLHFARWGMAATLMFVLWPLFPLLGARLGGVTWAPRYAALALAFGAACLLYLGLRARSLGLHRSLCGRQVYHLADWWSPERWERMRARRQEGRQLDGARPGSRLLAGVLARAVAAGRRTGAAALPWQLAWVLLSRSLPQSRRVWSPALMVILSLFVLPYVDSLFDCSETIMRGWFTGWIVAPALWCSSGMVRLGRRNAILARRADRERAGLLVGFAIVVFTGALGVIMWSCGHALAPVMPAMAIAGRSWTYHVPARHVAWLALAIAPAQLLSCVLRRRPGTSWPAMLGFQVLLQVHILLLGIRHAVSVPIVAGFALSATLAYVLVWRRRCRHGEIVE